MRKKVIEKSGRFLLGLIVIFIFQSQQLSPTTENSSTNSSSSNNRVSSFFMPRSVISEGSRFTLTMPFTTENQKAADLCIVQLTPFYQISTNGSQLAQYFLPGGKDCLSIAGSQGTVKPDISATWLLIGGKNREGGDNEKIELYANRFSSVIKLRPQMSRWGVHTFFFKEFSWDKTELFFSCVAPIAYARSTLRMKESDCKNSCSSYGEINDYTVDDQNISPNPTNTTRVERPTLQHSLSAKQALSHPLWRYAQFSDRAVNTAGIADIKCTLGLYALKNERATIGFYGSLLIPTHDKPNTEKLFSPLIGNGQHWGLGFGANAHALMATYEQCEAHIISEVDYLYLFANHQYRTFDLAANGPLSRYLLVFDPFKEEVAAQRTMLPGVNRFTQRVKVTPQSDLTWSTACLFTCPSLDISFSCGYNLWWKQREKIDFRPCHKSCDPSRVSIMNLFVDRENNPAKDDNPFSLQENNKATISDHFLAARRAPGVVPGVSQKTATLGRIFLERKSGAFPGIIGHTIFGSLRYEAQLYQHPFAVALGSSYELNNDKRLLQSYSIWLECSLSL